ncbi:MAG: DUF6607 family protein [Myxococcota bacterium]
MIASDRMTAGFIDSIMAQTWRIALLASLGASACATTQAGSSPADSPPVPAASASTRPSGAPEAVEAQDYGRTVSGRGLVPFAWPFEPPKRMQPRGGTTRGTPVTLASSTAPEFAAYLESSATAPKVRDRRAILAMAGDYRVSFQFTEIAGFGADYEPPQPYFSWGTEHVHVLEDRDDFVSLQHTLVVYLQKDDGGIEGPIVIKHWRQDWTYEDDRMLVFESPRTWRSVVSPPESGSWTQAVYQVDDSPRYEVRGRWVHHQGGAYFETSSAPRPLPRREFSVRGDYDTLRSQFRITLTPTGWVHETTSLKVAAGERVLAREIGVNRYERILSPDVAGPARSYWDETGAYWKAVRRAWSDHSRDEVLSLRAKVEDKKLFEHHFEFAARLQDEDLPSAEVERHARETVERFLSQEGK